MSKQDKTCQTDTKRDLIWSYFAVRKALGFLGIALPIIVVGRHLIATAGCQVLPTISHYYYTVAGDVFVGTLCAYGVFLFMYVGYDNKENCLANVAAVAAIMIALFPTNPTDEQKVSHAIWACSNLVHNISVGVFFCILGYFSRYKFTLTKCSDPNDRTEEKKIRDKIYRVCGIIILSCIAILAFCVLIEMWENPLKVVGEFVFKSPIAIILEILCLWAFGISWLTKGEMIYKDIQK